MDSLKLEEPQVEQLGGDVYIHGRVIKGNSDDDRAK